MNEQDKRISRLYKETYGNVQASEEFKEKVINMKEKKYKKGKITKVICALAAAVILVMAGSVIVSASRIEYDKIIFNGEEKMARYVDFGTGTRLWECEANDTAYTVWIYGDFDKENNILYFVDHGDYFLASTDPNQTLNLYEDIDKSDVAQFKEIDGEKWLLMTDNVGTQQMLFDEDETDGVADGKYRTDENTVTTYALLPNGVVVETDKRSNLSFTDGIERALGMDRTSMWGDIYNQLDSYKEESGAKNN